MSFQRKVDRNLSVSRGVPVSIKFGGGVVDPENGKCPDGLKEFATSEKVSIL